LFSTIPDAVVVVLLKFPIECHKFGAETIILAALRHRRPPIYPSSPTKPAISITNLYQLPAYTSPTVL